NSITYFRGIQMDKLMLQAVAGAGKTKYLLDNLNTVEKTAIITYTQKNQDELKDSIIKKFGGKPPNIHVFGLFEFLYSFCYAPLQRDYSLKGICFESPHYLSKSYHTSDGRIFSSRLSKYILDNNLPHL